MPAASGTITQLVPLVGAVAPAGLVIGAIEISALAGKFTLLINALSGGLLIPTLLLSALFLVLLGMGMPTPAVYIMGAALLALVNVEEGQRVARAVEREVTPA